MKKIGRFHLLTDTNLQVRYSHVELTAMALAGGADTIQFRCKSGSTKEMIASAVQMKKLCKEAGVPLIINDRVDIALAAEADGVHLGQDDFPIPLARNILGPDAIIGGSAGDMDEALKCLSDGVDYIGAGPVYATGSKSDAGPATGIENIRIIVEKISLPVIAIGGIKALDVNNLLDAGAYGVAVISAVCLDNDPETAASRFRTVLDNYGQK